MTDGTDEALLRRAVLAGDEGAWRILFDRHYAALHGYIRRRCADTGRADDVLQEVWMTAVRRIDAFDPEKGAFGAWLTGIADRTLRNSRRWWRRRDTAEITIDADHAAGGNGAIDVRDLVAVVMAALPERYQAVLTAKYHEQQTVAEIARRWQESEKTVESLLTRARQAFRTEYRKHEA